MGYGISKMDHVDANKKLLHLRHLKNVHLKIHKDIHPSIHQAHCYFESIHKLYLNHESRIFFTVLISQSETGYNKNYRI